MVPAGEVDTLEVVASEVAVLVVEEVEEAKPREREAVRVQEVLAKVLVGATWTNLVVEVATASTLRSYLCLFSATNRVHDISHIGII